MIFAEACREEAIGVLIIKMSTFFDHRFCQSRQSCEVAVLGQATLTNSLDIGRIESFLQGQSRVERDRPFRGVGHRVRKQDSLDLCFREGAAVYVAEQTDEAVDQDG